MAPKSSRDEIGGVRTLADGRRVFEARVRAAPEKGAANAALATPIAAALGRPNSAIAVVSGTTSRLKSVRAEGDPALLEAEVCALLGW